MSSNAMSGPDALMRSDVQPCAGPPQGDLIKIVVVIAVVIIVPVTRRATLLELIPWPLGNPSARELV
jgi:hypothetical protein